MALIFLVMGEVGILPNLFGRLWSLRVSVKLKVKVPPVHAMEVYKVE